MILLGLMKWIKSVTNGTVIYMYFHLWAFTHSLTLVEGVREKGWLGVNSCYYNIVIIIVIVDG